MTVQSGTPDPFCFAYLIKQPLIHFYPSIQFGGIANTLAFAFQT